MSKIPLLTSASDLEPEYVSSDKVRQLLGYTNRSSFFQAVRQAGIPYVRINARRMIFPVAGVRAWLASRTVGALPANYMPTAAPLYVLSAADRTGSEPTGNRTAAA